MYKYITTFCKVMVVFMLIGLWVAVVHWLSLWNSGAASMYVIVTLAALITSIIHGTD